MNIESSAADAVGLHLEVISGNAANSTILVEDELVIGRHADGAGKLSDDSEISRQHARISREARGDYAIEDLGSANGTFVNGLRIASPRLLSLGDSIEVGATTLVVRAIVGTQTQPEAAPDAPQSAPAAAPTVFARAPVLQPDDTQTPQEPPAPAPQDAQAPPSPAPDPPAPRAPAPTVFARAPVLQPDDPQTPAPDAQSADGPSADSGARGDTLPAGEPPAADEQEAETPSPASEVPAKLAFTVEVDFESHEVRVALADNAETFCLVLENERWQLKPSES